MTNRSVKNNSNLRRYKRRFVIISISLSIFLAFFIYIFVFNIVQTARTIKKFQSLIESNFSKIDEVLEFLNGDFSIIIPQKDYKYFIFGSVDKNISKNLPFKQNTPYKMKDFKGFIYKLSLETDVKLFQEKWLTFMQLSSETITINGDLLSVEENVKGVLYSKENPKLNNTTLLAASVFGDMKKNILRGKELIIKSPEGLFTAKSFEVFVAQENGKFTNNVLLDNKDYKIQSLNLDASMKDGKIKDMIFKQKVVFYDKGENGLTVYGDIAIYNYEKSEITIYGNVIINATKNNLSIEAESFNYNEKTKIGDFKSKNNTKEGDSSRINLNIDI